MKLTTFTVTDASTAHITKEDNGILEIHSNRDTEDNSHPITILRYYHGFLVSVWLWNANVGASKEEITKAEKELRRHGYSASFINLLKISGKQGAKWLCLDCDGTMYDDLPEHEW